MRSKKISYQPFLQTSDPCGVLQEGNDVLHDPQCSGCFVQTDSRNVLDGIGLFQLSQDVLGVFDGIPAGFPHLDRDARQPLVSSFHARDESATRRDELAVDFQQFLVLLVAQLAPGNEDLVADDEKAGLDVGGTQRLLQDGNLVH